MCVNVLADAMLTCRRVSVCARVSECVCAYE